MPCVSLFSIKSTKAIWLGFQFTSLTYFDIASPNLLMRLQDSCIFPIIQEGKAETVLGSSLLV